MTETIYVVPRPAGARNADCVFTIRAIDPDTKLPVDFDCDVWVYVGLPGGKEQKIAAGVSGPDAVVRIESEVGNQVRATSHWTL